MEKISVFDGHCDTISRCLMEGQGFWENNGHLDLKRTRKFGRYAQFFAIFGDGARCCQPLWELTKQEYALFRREMERNEGCIVHCRTGEEARAAQTAGKMAAFLSVEGAELLECDLGRLEEAWKMGVRAVNLTWNHANRLSGTNVEEPDRGLSLEGKRFVDRMEALGMLIDVSHLSDPGFWDVAERCTKPFFASHSNARAAFSHPRNLTDEQFTAIIEHHGVAGLNFYADFLGQGATLETVLAHLEHFLALGGEQCVALGGDWDGIARMPQGIRGIQDIDRFRELLLRRNYPEALIEDLFYNNLMRVVSEVCTM